VLFASLTSPDREKVQMATFLVMYVGAGMPHDPELMAQARAAFQDWLTQVGDAVTDPGAPVRTVATIAAGEPAAQVEVSGYSVVEAADLDAVKQLLSTHPFIGRGGTLQVSECMTV
jgi:hypothetical protein